MSYRNIRKYSGYSEHTPATSRESKIMVECTTCTLYKYPIICQNSK
jgi:hypothetical protein